MSIPASATVLTRNCAAALERCLASIRDFDDIVVLDGNSTDGTPETARRSGARVLPQTDSTEPEVRITNFTEVRQKSFDAARHDWVYMIDADEWVGPEHMDAVRDLVARNRTDEVYLFRKLAVVDGRVVRHAYYYPDYSLRMLAKSGGAHWRPGRRVHERIIVPEGVRRVRVDAPVYSAMPDIASARAKDRRYLAMALQPYLRPDIPRGLCLRVAGTNVLKAGVILARIAGVHLRHGFRDTMPLAQHLRFPAYHLRLAAMVGARAFRRPYA